MTKQAILNLIAITLLILLSVLMSIIWHGKQGLLYSFNLVSIIADILLPDLQASSTTEVPQQDYFFFGRFTLIFYAAILLNLKQARNNMNTQFITISCVLLTIAMVGDFFAYWLSEALGNQVRALGFWYTELPALLLLFLYWLTLAIKQSITSKKGHHLLWLLPMTLASVGTIQYLPHSLLLVILIVTSVNDFMKLNLAKPL